MSTHLKWDLTKSVGAGVLRELLANYRVLLYNGNMDGSMCCAMGTARMLDALEWEGQREFASSPRQLWRMPLPHHGKSDKDDQLVSQSETDLRPVAGYVRQAYNLTFVVVANSGHLVPHDRPREALDMLERFLFDKNWD